MKQARMVASEERLSPSQKDGSAPSASPAPSTLPGTAESQVLTRTAMTLLARVQPRWRRRILWAAALLAAVVALRMTLLRPAPVPVTVSRAAPGRVEESATNSKSGTVRSRRRATLSAEVGGRVVELPVPKGSRVGAGEILMRLADSEFRAQVSLQTSALEATRAAREESCRAAELAQRELSRHRQLARQQIVSQELLDQLESRRDTALAACEAASARIRQAEATVDVARANLEKTVLRAPFSGLVAEISTELGEWITPSPPGLPIPPVIVIFDPEGIYVSAPMDEVDLGRVRAGQPVRITMDAHPSRSFSGRVTRVARYVLDVADQNRTFEIEAEFDDARLARSLLPGTSADIEVILGAKDDVLRIPSYALLEGNRVLVVEEGKLAARRVETGLNNWEYTEVTEGLVAGDPVVVSLDRPEVREGARASIQGEAQR